MNETKKYTPGPWRQYAPRIYDSVDEDYRTILGGDGLRRSGFELTGFISEADARLMAAAPELLHACELLLMLSLPQDVSGMAMVEVARQSVTKAKGIEQS